MKQRINLEKLTVFFTKHPARFFLLAAFLWFGLMCYLNSKDVGENGFSWHDLLVEANGMVFDLLVFGILLSVYEALREKKEKIERLHEEIDDYRGWDEKEAIYRIVGAIKRLKKLGVSNIDLNNCYFKGADLRRTDFRNAILEMADFEMAFLDGADLRGVNLKMAKFRFAYLQNTNLQGANLQGADFRNANLQGANLQGANLRDANLQGANLQGANLRDANLKGVEFRGIKIESATPWFTTQYRGIKRERAKYDWSKLDGLKVDFDWFEKLEEWNIMGKREIKRIYSIDENRVLRNKKKINDVKNIDQKQ